jgi:type IV secretory pathway VirB2 component (pilin)
MFEPRGARRECRHPDACACHERAPRRIELWRLHGVKGELCGAAIETRVGWALRLELDSELLQQLFQPSLVGLAFRSRSAEGHVRGLAIGRRRGWTKGGRMTRTDHGGQRRGQERGRPWARALAVALAAVVLIPTLSYAQASPWENAVNVLMVSFTGPLARGLSLVSIVIGGLTFAFGEGGSKRLVVGIVFGVGMAIGAVNFMGWLFP